MRRRLFNLAAPVAAWTYQVQLIGQSDAGQRIEFIGKRLELTF